MSTLLWSIAFLLLGILLFFGIPILCGPWLPREYREPLANKYFSMAMAAMKRAIIVIHKTGGVSLYASSFDDEHEQEKLDGVDRWFDDPLSLMGHFRKKPLGLVDERYGIILNPVYAEAAEQRARQHDQEAHNWTRGDDNEEVLKTPHCEIPAGTRLVDVRECSKALWHSAYPSVPDSVKTFVKHMLSMYGSRNIVKDAMLLIAFGSGFGLVWLAYAYGGASSGGGVDNPIELGVTILPVIAW